jgi:hypothetical protein
MHPYISQAIAEQRAADLIRAADASRRGREARQTVKVSTQQAHQSYQSYRARRAARRELCAAGASMTVSGSQCR